VFSISKTLAKVYKNTCNPHPVDWPRFGLSAEEAVSLLEDEANNGFIPVLSNSVYCYRHMQADGYPLRVLAVRDPVTLIGLVPAGSLPAWMGRLAWILMKRRVDDCIFIAGQYGSIEVGLWELGVLKASLEEVLNASRVGEVPVQVIDRETAADAIVGSATEDSAVILVDSLTCLWGMQKNGGLRRVFVVERPLLVAAVAGLEVDGELKASGQPALMMVDEDDEDCIMGGIVRNTPTADYRSTFRAILSNMLKNPLDTPLELLIKANKVMPTRNLDKQPTRG
jgi:hypothetical protein